MEMTDIIEEIAKIDDTDRKILGILQEDATRSKADIARCVGLAPSAVFERIKRMEQQELILGYEVRINPRKLGLDLVAYVFVKASKPSQSRETGTKIRELPSVEEVHRITGEDCFLVKLRVRNSSALTETLEKIAKIPTVGAVRTTIVLDTIKECRRRVFLR